MQINVILNDNKSIKQYSNNSFEGSQLATINDADAYSLAEYSSLMWVDDNGLVHADNLPTTKYEQDINQTKADIAAQQQQVADDIQAIQAKIDTANQASSALDAKIQTANETTAKMIGQVQLQLAKEVAGLKTTATDTTTSASDTTAK